MRLTFFVPLLLLLSGSLQAAQPLAATTEGTNHFSYEGEMAWSGNIKPYTKGKIRFRQIHAPGAQSAIIWTGGKRTADWAVSQQPGPDVMWDLKNGPSQTPQPFDTDAFLATFLGSKKAVKAETLSYWWKGQTDPSHPVLRLKLDNDGRPKSFTQQGWKVRYHAWAETKNGLVPARFQLKRGRLKINLIQTKVDSSKGPFTQTLTCPLPPQSP